MQSAGKAIVVVLGVILALALAAVGFGVATYNGIVSKANTVEQKEADIDSQLQRRIDLIPNLVEVTKQYAQHETDVFDSVTAARQAMVSASTMAEKADADAAMGAALGGLVAVAENYPELTSSTVYIDLMDELAGTENRIAYSRTEYNAAVRDYNTAVEKFPGAVFARLFGFEKAGYYEATPGADAPVSVDLSLG